MSVSKIPFLFVSALGMYVSATAPATASASELSKEVGTVERAFSPIAPLYAGASKLLICSGSLLEVAVILASKYPSHPLSQRILHALVPGPIALTNRIGISPAFLAGCGLVAVGGFIRYQCYCALGRFFTLQVAIRDDHQLVTSGPYAYVRHPSYTGSLATAVGMSLCWLSRGSWLRECGILDRPGAKMGMGLYAAFVGLAAVILARRGPLEDEMLRREFGEQWDAWASRVRYRMIPYVY